MMPSLLACLLLAAAPAPATPTGPAPATTTPPGPAAATATATAAAPAPAKAAPAPGTCTSPVALAAWATDTSAPMGAWAEYASLVDGKPVPEESIRVFLIDTGTPEKPQRWFELDRKDGRVAFRIPMDGQGGGAPLIKQGRMFFELPSGEIEEVGACRAPGKEPTRTVTLTTPAGRFQTRYIKRMGGPLEFEYWVAEGVPPLGLVQLKITPEGGGKGMILTGRGTEAVSAFPDRFTVATFPSPESFRALLPLDPPGPDAGVGPPAGQDAGAAAPPGPR